MDDWRKQKRRIGAFKIVRVFPVIAGLDPAIQVGAYRKRSPGSPGEAR